MEYVEVARAESERGDLVLRERRADGAPPVLELRANGVFVMDTVEISTERALATAALELVDDPAAVVVGGLGLGYTMHEVLADHRVQKCAVVEIEEALVDWMRTGVVSHGPHLLADERVTIVVADIAVALAEAGPASYDLVLLDVDNGPGYLVHDANAALYAAAVPRRGPGGAAPGRRPGDLVGRRVARARGDPARGLRRRRGQAVRRAAPGARGALLALRRAGSVSGMSSEDNVTGYRTEHDSMGEVRVPGGRPVAGADPACGRELPDQRHPPRAAAGPGARPGQGRVRAGQRRARHPHARAGRGDPRRRGRGGRRRARRALPGRHLPDRVGHQLEHERQRGDRDAGGPGRHRRPPQRPRQRQPVQQRHVPDRDPRRGDARRGRGPPAGAPPARGQPGRQGRGVRRAGEVRSHPPDGRDAGDARPGVRRVRRDRAVRRRAARGRAAPGARAGPGGHRGRHRHQHAAGLRRPGDRDPARARRAGRSPRPATTSRPRAPGTPWSS